MRRLYAVVHRLTEQDRALGEAAGIPSTLLLPIKQSGQNLRRLEGRTPDGNAVEAAGVTIDVDRTKALSTVRRLQEVTGSGYLVFVSEQNFGIQGDLDEVSVLKTGDPYDALRTMGTNGANYDLDTNDVIARLKLWDARYGVRLHGVGFDWVAGDLARPPGPIWPPSPRKSTSSARTWWIRGQAPWRRWPTR